MSSNKCRDYWETPAAFGAIHLLYLFDPILPPKHTWRANWAVSASILCILCVGFQRVWNHHLDKQVLQALKASQQVNNLIQIKACLWDKQGLDGIQHRV